jgi:signal transduction histidine kinase
VSELEERGGLATEFHVEDLAGTRVSGEAELALFRALQEGLANVVRHAQASRVGVTLRHTPAAVELTLTDDGVGFDPSSLDTENMGLTGMRERVAALGGQLEITTAVGAGVRLRVTLPGEVAR